MEDNLLSIGEAAKLMGVCENTLRDWDVEKKFQALRTEGGHRRYPLSQIREYLDQNQPVKSFDVAVKKRVEREYAEIIDKWEHYLGDVEGGSDRGTLAILLENCALSNVCRSGLGLGNPSLSLNQMLFLTKQGWLRCRLRKMVSVQPMLGPTTMVHYLEHDNWGASKLRSEVTAAKTTKYDFSVFVGVDFEQVKEIYADAIGRSLDAFIYNFLINEVGTSAIEVVTKSVAAGELFKEVDYFIGSKGNIDKLGKSLEHLDVYEMPIFMNAKLEPQVVLGRYPKSNLSLPVFCPYILLDEIPRLNTYFSNFHIRAGWFGGDKDVKKDTLNWSACCYDEKENDV